MELRKSYKMTELGIIPTSWNLKKLDKLCVKLNVGFVGVCEPFYTVEGAGILLIRTGNLQDDKFVFNDSKYVSEVFHLRNQKSRVTSGDILIARHGSSGSAVIVPENIKDANTLNIVILRIDKSKIDNVFAAYCINSSFVRKQVLKSIAGSTQGVINTKEIAKLFLPLPSLGEQTFIANALSDVDALINRLEKLIEKKRLINLGAMQKLLAPKENWIQMNLGNCALLKARIGWQGLTTKEYKKSGEYYLITGTEFRNGFIDFDQCHFVDYSRYKQDLNIQVKKDDILITKDGTIGKVAFIKTLAKPATLNSGVFVIRPKNKAFDPLFMFYVFRSQVFTDFLAQLSAGSTISHLYQKDFVHFEFKIPKTLNEQKQIAQSLMDIDESIQFLEQKLYKFRQVKQGMMQNLLTGKIRLVRPLKQRILKYS